MLKFLNRFRFGWRRADPPGNSSAVSKDEAKRYLNRLREEELSAGASLRRGEILDRAPGQASGSAYTPYPQQKTPAPSSQQQYRDDPEQNTSGEDFATSVVVADATGSALTGYAVGGSVAGAITGEAVSKSLDD
ncbi:hypothetical protein [Cupriavidus nantongensis]|uniref:hypothetical protein n=1 Tax=Cupriavidus nantongensis TaxID=1796606 RepID=UPI000B247392|nr:hypothetical protein [Cupriavidus nantongensis]